MSNAARKLELTPEDVATIEAAERRIDKARKDIARVLANATKVDVEPRQSVAEAEETAQRFLRKAGVR